MGAKQFYSNIVATEGKKGPLNSLVLVAIVLDLAGSKGGRRAMEFLIRGATHSP